MKNKDGTIIRQSIIAEGVDLVITADGTLPNFSAIIYNGKRFVPEIKPGNARPQAGKSATP